MRPMPKRLLTAGVLIVLASMMLSGCVVCLEDAFYNERPPRMATLHVYARDYYTGAPIPWAQVELYEESWLTWAYQGTWPMNQTGYIGVPCGYLYYDGCGGSEEEDFRVLVYAPGYSSESYEIELSYYYPSEILTFYLAPYNAREAGDAPPDADSGRVTHEGEGTSEVTQQRGRVVVGESEGATGE